MGFFAWEYAAEFGQIATSLHNLTKYGCEIERDANSAELIRSGLGVWADYLQSTLITKQPYTIEVYNSTNSTQDLVKSRANEHLLIFADEQTAGRGRLGRSWIAPPGTGLLFSMTHSLSPDRPDSIDRISFLAAVAVAQAIERITEHDLIQIRWPNDIYVDHRKLAGILVETVQPKGSSATVAIIGIGINVDLTKTQLSEMSQELRSLVTSFEIEGWRADRLYIAEQVISQIEHHLRVPNIPLLVDEWRVRNLHREQTLKLKSNGQTITGTVIDLDPDHGLIVRRDTGEIVHLPAATTSVL